MESRPSRTRSGPHRLVTLGRLTLLAPDGAEDPSLGTRRRKLAVLAYLALRGRPATRDHLAALFWGGRDDDRARNSLSDALSHLRRVLGREAVVTRGDEVSLAADATLVVDAIELAVSVAAKDWARAIALYGGPFLDCVYVDDAPEFEQWSAGEAERLRRLFTRACAPLALTLAQSRQWEACADLAARWLAAEPASTDAMLYRLNALKAPGTIEARTVALAEHDRMRARLADELGIGMDPAVERLATSIRAELPPMVLPATAAAHPTPLPTPDTPSTASRPAARTQVAAATQATRVPRRTRAPLAAVFGAAVVILGASAYGARHSAERVRPVLAVLPFENLGQPSDAYFADGLTDEVRTRLTAISGLQVIGGTSARQYKGTTKTPRDIARELGATYLLTGSVRWERTAAGGRVRVSPELVRASDQADVWAEPVEGSLDDVFALQAQVAERVAAALDVALLAPERRTVVARPTTNLAAYDAYLRGIASVSSATWFSAAARRATQAEFERAVTLDPTFAAAYARLAASYLHDFEQAGDSATAVVARARTRAAVERAWALDSTLVESRLARAGYLSETGDRAEAARLVRGAARVAPDNVEVLGALGSLEFGEGRYEEAVATHRRAAILDPRAANDWGSMAGELDRLRRYDEAIAAREREIALVPNSDVAYAAQASSYLLWRGDTAMARRTIERGSPTLPWVVRLPGGIAGNAVWAHLLPATVFHARDTLTLAGYLAGAGGIAPELYHLVKLRHHLQNQQLDLARAHADSLVSLLAPVVQRRGDAHWFFGWFSRRSVLAEAYATLGRAADAARETDRYVVETRASEAAREQAQPEQLCHALYNAAYVDAQIGRKDVAVARLAEALPLQCGMRLSRALLRVDPSWTPLRGYPPFEALLAARE